jgi:hypothetical protein
MIDRYIDHVSSRDNLISERNHQKRYPATETQAVVNTAGMAGKLKEADCAIHFA